MDRRAIVHLLWMLACCGAPAGPGEPQAPGPGAKIEADAARPGLVMVLFRDGAMVWDRRRMDIAAGQSELIFEPVPGEIMPGSATLVSLSNATGLRVVGPARGAQHTDGDIDGSTGRDDPGHLAWTVEAARAGSHLVEAVYVTDALGWRAGYTLILDPGGNTGVLRGDVGIDNRTAVDFAHARVRVADTPLAGRAENQAGDSNSHTTGKNSSNASGKAMPHTARLPRATTIAAHSTATYPLFAEGRPVQTATRLFYDPVGANLDHHGLVPLAGQAYGVGDPALRGNEVVHHRVEIVSDDRTAHNLPGGELRVYERANSGELVYLGRGPGFSPAEPAESVPGVTLGPARGWRARRWQSDFFHDPGARRLIEEIRVELESRVDSDQVVVVREHLYRGLNWTVAYHNDTGAPRKVGPQAIRFEAHVPARQSVLIMYRVVYTW